MERSLREALNYRGCLICHVLDKDETDFIAQLQYETIKDEKVRQDLVSSNGYCNFHFYMMSRLSSPIVNATLAKDLIERDLGEIEKGSFESTRGANCPACRYMREREESYLEEFAALVSDKVFQKEYEGTDGLCRIHLKKVLNSVEDELSRFLLTTQVLHLRLLKVELDTFLSKVRSTSRDMGEEKDSWWVAIEKIVGKKGLRYF
jgi:hypothetical protein